MGFQKEYGFISETVAKGYRCFWRTNMLCFQKEKTEISKERNGRCGKAMDLLGR